MVTFVPTLIGAISDFFVAGFPILFLRQLQLPKRQKWILVLVFSLGFLYDICVQRVRLYADISRTCAAGVMRVVTLYFWQYMVDDVICQWIFSIRKINVRKQMTNLRFELTKRVRLQSSSMDHD